MVTVYKEKGTHATMVKFAFYGIVVCMKKTLFVLMMFTIPAFAQAINLDSISRDCSQCDYVNPPQGASVGGGMIFAGCRDPRAVNYNQYFTHDGGECIYSDGSKIPADSKDLIRNSDGLPTGGTYSELYIEATEMRPVPDMFMSPTFKNGKVRVNPATLPETFRTLTCSYPLLNENLSTMTPLKSFEVMKLQFFFKKRLERNILVTGNYRAQTTKAVLELQRKYLAKGEYVQGVVDTPTKNLVNSLECKAKFEEFLRTN